VISADRVSAGEQIQHVYSGTVNSWVTVSIQSADSLHIWRDVQVKVYFKNKH